MRSRHVQPVVEVCVVVKELFYFYVGAVDVFRVSDRAAIGTDPRHGRRGDGYTPDKSRECEGLFHTFIEGDLRRLFP